MGRLRTSYVDHRTGRRLVLEKDDDGIVPPPTIRLHEPLVGEAVYSYAGTEFPATAPTPPASYHCKSCDMHACEDPSDVDDRRGVALDARGFPPPPSNVEQSVTGSVVYGNVVQVRDGEVHP